MLKAQGCPRDRYQILCHNCNLAKYYYGVCPHETEAKKLLGLPCEIRPLRHYPNRPKKQQPTVAKVSYRSKKCSDEEISALAKRYLSHQVSMSELSKEIGVSIGTIHRWIHSKTDVRLEAA